MNGDTLTLIGLAIAAVGLIGGFVVRDRQVHSSIDTKVANLRDEVNHRTDELHERINRTRDDMVRQADLQAHTTRIEGMLSNMQGQLNMLMQHLLKKE